MRYGIVVFVLLLSVMMFRGMAQGEDAVSPLEQVLETSSSQRRWTANDLFAIRYWALRANPGRTVILPTLCEACIAASHDSDLDFVLTRERCFRACGLDGSIVDLSN